jgi:hypothetical protein
VNCSEPDKAARNKTIRDKFCENQMEMDMKIESLENVRRCAVDKEKSALCVSV